MPPEALRTLLCCPHPLLPLHLSPGSRQPQGLSSDVSQHAQLKTTSLADLRAVASSGNSEVTPLCSGPAALNSEVKALESSNLMRIFKDLSDKCTLYHKLK